MTDTPEPPENMEETPPGPPGSSGPSIDITAEMKTSFIDYAMSVIISRAIPDLRDGLKPVHRRILFAMHETNNVHDKPYRKSARPVGDVMGQYHPHGDSAIYDALVRMAQDFSMSLPLLDGQGNFGSMDGDNPAAMRYTEVRMAAPAQYMLADIDKDTVDFQDNLRRQAAGTDGPARPIPQHAGQRRGRHRGRHGHEHPAPQPRRGHRRLSGADPEPRPQFRAADRLRPRPPTFPPAR